MSTLLVGGFDAKIEASFWIHISSMLQPQVHGFMVGVSNQMKHSMDDASANTHLWVALLIVEMACLLIEQPLVYEQYIAFIKTHNILRLNGLVPSLYLA